MYLEYDPYLSVSRTKILNFFFLSSKLLKRKEKKKRKDGDEERLNHASKSCLPSREAFAEEAPLTNQPSTHTNTHRIEPDNGSHINNPPADRTTSNS